MGNIVVENLCNVRNHGLKPVYAKASSRGDMRILRDMGDKFGIAGEMWSFTWHTKMWRGDSDCNRPPFFGLTDHIWRGARSWAVYRHFVLTWGPNCRPRGEKKSGYRIADPPTSGPASITVGRSRSVETNGW